MAAWIDKGRGDWLPGEDEDDEPAPQQSGVVGIEYPVLRCPHCNSKEVLTPNTLPPADGVKIRYHKCKCCEKPFKTIERL